MIPPTDEGETVPSDRIFHRRRLIVYAIATLVVAALTVAIAAYFAPWELAVGNLVVRSQKGAHLPFPTPPGGALATSDGRRDPVVAEDDRPRNVVLIIGDGMGIGQLSTAADVLNGPTGRMAIETAPVTGLVRTHAGDRLVTDSAAASTAMATGFKVPKKAISVLDDGRVPVTLFEAARSAGMATGVVTTSGLVDATPAGFIAHQPKRELYAEILDDMLASQTEVLIGGDWGDSSKALRNDDFQSRLRSIDSLAAAAGYELARTAGELVDSTGRVLALFPPRNGRGEAHGPDLADLAVFAVERLDTVGDGFVLLIESEVTDSMGHDTDVAGLAAGVRELDRAVAKVFGWAGQRGDTLVLVTADHDTGGLGITAGTYAEGVAEVRWASDGHTAQWVPLFALGPGADGFNGVLDNTDIGIIIGKLLGLQGFPAVRP